MMDLGANIRRIKDNLFLIPEARFDDLTKDADYKDSLIYLVACLILAIPIQLIVSLAQGTLIASLVMLPVVLVLTLVLCYVSYGIEFLLLRLLGGQASLLQSMQIFIYGSTSYLIFSSIPCISFLLSIVAIGNIVRGSVHIHKISLLRAIIALVVIPIAIVLVLAVILAMVAGYLTPQAPAISQL
jgi:hypothetical protein